MAANQAQASAGLLPSGGSLHPCFKIASTANDVATLPPQGVLGGTRLHASYSGGTVKPLGGSLVANLEGVVLSGHAWVLLREDGVAVFDVRLTLARERKDAALEVFSKAVRQFEDGKAPDPLDFLLNANVTGLAKLPAPKPGQASYPVHVALPIAFEGSGPEKPYATARLRFLAANYANYKDLLVNQCMVGGTFELKAAGDKFTSVGAFDLDVYALVTP
jgi:hypothetical protein